MKPSGQHRAPTASGSFWGALGARLQPRQMLPLAAFLAVASLLGVTALAPYSVGSEAVYAADAGRLGHTDGLDRQEQALEVLDGAAGALTRDAVETVERKALAPVAAVPDPGTAKAYALDRVLAQGWSSGEYDCLVLLWQRESGWRVNAENRSSGAYGIPQALPGRKMASVGADWRTNHQTQIKWGIGYIKSRYKTPCGAWQHFTIKNWY